MKYVSTRSVGLNSSVPFEDALLSAYAPDGGLYVPAKLPLFTDAQFSKWQNCPLQEVCADIMHIFTDIDIAVLVDLSRKAFLSFNDDGMGKDALPLWKMRDGLYTLDASLGPTFAFKDIGQQITGQLLNHVLGMRKKHANILIDTSGDTGPAAIAGVRGCRHVDIFCLYPRGRVSEVQELQMITAIEDNVHVYCTDGNNDDQCSVLKEIFRDSEFCQSFNVCSVNSINWVRIAAQSTYYVWAYLALCKSEKLRIGSKINFFVPTGAFGNAMGGFLAKRMGLPIDRIICATNKNDIVHRTLKFGDMSMSDNIQVNGVDIYHIIPWIND